MVIKRHQSVRYGLYSKFWGIAQDKHKNFGNDIVFDPQVRNIDIFHPKTYKIRCYEQYRFDKNLLGQVAYCCFCFLYRFILGSYLFHN